MATRTVAPDRSIRAYRARRDFAATPEPAPTRRAAPRADPMFVVQKHDATRLHWDFRLEHRGVLLSWAVPKGPSLDPHDKRLAVHVEDHPLDYAGFEGVIPEGNYGAGTVEIWDRGTWQPQGDVEAALRRGELKFTLAGERLRGGFVLVRLKPRPRERAENWLLIKEHDAEERPGEDAAALERAVARPHRQAPWTPPHDARPGKLPEKLAPMLASTADAPPTGEDWLAEIKFDGYRLLAFKDGETVRLVTRNGLDWTHKFPTIAHAVRTLPAGTLLLDGEVVALRPDGLSSFADLQAALSAGHDAGLIYYVFDLLHRDGTDLRPASLLHRKEALAPLIPHQGPLRVSDHLAGATPRVRARACGMGLEGIICKRAGSAYRPGRGRDWLKVKCQGREEFLVIGYTRPKGSRAGLGALQLGVYDPQGALHYIGGCGSGFDEATLLALVQRLEKRRIDPPPHLRLTEEPPPPGVIWVAPELIAEVQYTAWSGAGRLRHAVFLGLREDKSPAEIVRDIPDPDSPRHELGARRTARIVSARRPAPRTDEVAGVRLTHPDRELWPGITKRDLADYWQRVAEAALPGIAERPLALVRCPEGIAGEYFFQKHANRGMPAGLHEGSHEGAPYLALEDTPGLLACAQMAAIELHGWGSTLADPGHPDRLVFDLDPAEDVSWDRVIEAALELRARLEDIGLASFPRTTGGKGLHLVVPLEPRADWPSARAWARAFAETLEHEAPDRYVASLPKARRRGRILIDWLRNGLGSTAVCSFSPRAREGATVATPLAWPEIKPSLDPHGFTIATIPARLARQKRDPWTGWEASAVALPEFPHG